MTVLHINPTSFPSNFLWNILYLVSWTLPSSLPNPLQSSNVSSARSHEAVTCEIVHSTLIAAAIKHAVASLVGQDKQIWWLSRPWPCITDWDRNLWVGEKDKSSRDSLGGRENQAFIVMRFSISRLRHVERGTEFMRKCETHLACFCPVTFSLFCILGFVICW